MRKTVYKLFFAWDFEAEERWLDQMAARGLALVSVGLCRYEFEPCLPGEWAVRLELLENLPGHPESERYIEFLEETGAEHVGSLLRWVYFRKRTELGAFDLFSDNASRIAYCNRMLWLFGGLAVSQVCMAVGNLGTYLSMGHGVNLFAAALCGTAALLLAGGLLRVRRKKRLLIKEQTLFE